MALKRKNVMVDEQQLRDLARRLGMSESAAIRHSVDGLLHFLEMEEAAEKIRQRGGLDDVFGRTRGEGRQSSTPSEVAPSASS
jgi:hypothetical protein